MTRTKPSATSMTDEELASFVERFDVDSLEWRDAGALRAIAEARDAAERAEATLREAVSSARNAGMTWASIGAVLRVSRQAAQQRFGQG